MIEAMRHVRELKTGGFAARKYVFRHAYGPVSTSRQMVDI